MNIKKIVEDLIDTFLKAGELSLSLREKGLIKEIKSDNTPVSNGDLEVNKFIIKKIYEVTPDIPIISEESSDNKNNSKLKNICSILFYINFFIFRILNNLYIYKYVLIELQLLKILLLTFSSLNLYWFYLMNIKLFKVLGIMK